MDIGNEAFVLDIRNDPVRLAIYLNHFYVHNYSFDIRSIASCSAFCCCWSFQLR